MKNKILYIFSMGTILVAIILVFICGWLAFVPVNVIHPNVQPYEVLTKTLQPGDTLVYTVDVCKYRDAPTTIVRRFVDSKGAIYALPGQENSMPKGCNKFGMPLVIPDSLRSGEWYLTIDISYKVNPLRTEFYHLRTQTFTITKEGDE